MDSNIKSNSSSINIKNTTINIPSFSSEIKKYNNHINSGTSNIKLENVKIESVNLDGNITMNIPTDVIGYYGGDQNKLNNLRMKRMGSIITFGIISLSEYEKRHFDTYTKILEKYGITKTGYQSMWMSEIQDHGCGFVTMANVIADYYKSNPDLFEKTYGFPLYDTDDEGHKLFNYDYILLDIFLRNDIPSKSYHSVDTADYEEYLKKAFPGQNVSVKICARDMSTETYLKAIQSGEYQYASVAISSYTLTPYGNNPDKTYTSKYGAHLMTVTGVSENGNLIVSSWGKQWEITGGNPYNSAQDGGLFLISVGDGN